MFDLFNDPLNLIWIALALLIGVLLGGFIVASVRKTATFS